MTTPHDPNGGTGASASSHATSGVDAAEDVCRSNDGGGVAAAADGSSEQVHSMNTPLPGQAALVAAPLSAATQKMSGNVLERKACLRDGDWGQGSAAGVDRLSADAAAVSDRGTTTHVDADLAALHPELQLAGDMDADATRSVTTEAKKGVEQATSCGGDCRHSVSRPPLTPPQLELLSN